MQKPLDTEIIIESNELDALIAFTQSRWNGNNVSPSDLTEILTTSFDAGLKAGALWFDNYAFFEAAKAWSNERKSQLQNSLQNNPALPNTLNYIHYDDVLSFGQDIQDYANDFHRVSKKDWDYSTHADNLCSSILKLYPNANTLKPNGWDALIINYSDFDGANEYFENGQQQRDINDFTGCDSASSGTDGFHANISLHTTMYNDVCQGRNPIRTLTAAAFSHGLFVASHNNTASALHNIHHCKEHLFSLYSEKISFIKHTDITNIPSSKILKGIQFCASFKTQYNIDTMPGFRAYTNQDELEKFIQHKLSSSKLTIPETPYERKVRMDAFLKNFSSELKSPEYQKKQDAFDDALSQAAMQFLSTTNLPHALK